MLVQAEQQLRASTLSHHLLPLSKILGTVGVRVLEPDTPTASPDEPVTSACPPGRVRHPRPDRVSVRAARQATRPSRVLATMGQCVSTAHLTALEDQISDAEHALSSYRTELSTRTEQLTAADAAATASKDEIAELKLQIRDLTVQRDVKEKQRGELETALDRRIREADGQQRVLEAAKQEALREVSLKKKEIERLGVQLVDIEHDREQIRGELGNAQEQLTTTRTIADEKIALIGTLESEKTALQLELDEARLAVDEVDAATAELDNRWRAQLDTARSTHAAELAAATTEHTSALSALQAELDSTRSTHAATLDEIQSTHSSLLEKHASDQHQSQASLQATVASLTAQLTASQAQHAAVVTELARQRENAHREIMDVRGSVTKSSSRFERLRAEHEILLQSNEMMTEELAKAREETAQLKVRFALCQTLLLKMTSRSNSQFAVQVAV